MIVEQWPDNTVIVSESFDSGTAAKLSAAIRNAPADIAKHFPFPQFPLP